MTLRRLVDLMWFLAPVAAFVVAFCPIEYRCSSPGRECNAHQKTLEGALEMYQLDYPAEPLAPGAAGYPRLVELGYLQWTPQDPGSREEGPGPSDNYVRIPGTTRVVCLRHGAYLVQGPTVRARLETAGLTDPALLALAGTGYPTVPAEHGWLGSTLPMQRLLDPYAPGNLFHFLATILFAVPTLLFLFLPPPLAAVVFLGFWFSAAAALFGRRPLSSRPSS